MVSKVSGGLVNPRDAFLYPEMLMQVWQPLCNSTVMNEDTQKRRHLMTNNARQHCVSSDVTSVCCCSLPKYYKDGMTASSHRSLTEQNLLLCSYHSVSEIGAVPIFVTQVKRHAKAKPLAHIGLRRESHHAVSVSGGVAAHTRTKSENKQQCGNGEIQCVQLLLELGRFSKERWCLLANHNAVVMQK